MLLDFPKPSPVHCAHECLLQANNALSRRTATDVGRPDGDRSGNAESPFLLFGAAGRRRADLIVYDFRPLELDRPFDLA